MHAGFDSHLLSPVACVYDFAVKAQRHVLLFVMLATFCDLRWASKAEEQPVSRASSSNRAPGQRQGSKRAKPGPDLAPDDDYNGLTAGLDGFFGKTQGHRSMPDNAKSTRGVLKKVMPAFSSVLSKLTDTRCST